MALSKKVFQNKIYRHFEERGRMFPWRKTRDPYAILVSEIMLQQTQTDRVIEKYLTFLSVFPTVEKLSETSLGTVLTLWQGLGYNRRAKALHSCARIIVEKYEGRVPRSFSDLVALPGIGPYTAGAMQAFAYNTPSIFVETNIRTVYLHFYFKGRVSVSDAEILKKVEQTFDEKEPRRWYSALMDYGAMLKREKKVTNVQSAMFVQQKPFKGSMREVRGALLKEVTQKKECTKQSLERLLFNKNDIKEQLGNLIKEGLLVETKTKVRLP